jgi:exopolysaccharide production protein ExoZ
MNRSPSSSPQAAKNLQSLQVLRAVAATSVVYFHIGAVPEFGSFGVDIFFVISGFVMAMIITGGQSPYTFAISRLARIVPLYWILTTGLLLLAAVKPELLNSTTADLGNYLKSLFFIPYVKENGLLRPMLHVGWTLNYEMFFYACLLVAIIAARRFYLPLTLLLLVLAYGVVGQSQNEVAAGFFGSTLLFEFGFGLCAFELYRRRWLEAAGKPALIVAALLSYGLMAVVQVADVDGPRWLVFGVPSVLLVLALTSLEGALFSRNSRGIRVLASIGDASYATYLSHFYVVEVFRKIAAQKFHLLDPYTPSGVLLIVLCSLLVGQVLYVLVDRPLSRYCRDKALAARPASARPALV